MSSDIPQAATPVVIGIDVAKERLDVHGWPKSQSLSAANSRQGVVELLERLKPLHIALIDIEATGRCERRCAFELMYSGYEVAIVNPRQPRDFARPAANSPRPTRSTRST